MIKHPAPTSARPRFDYLKTIYRNKAKGLKQTQMVMQMTVHRELKEHTDAGIHWEK
jgi:hypothetical protein